MFDCLFMFGIWHCPLSVSSWNSQDTTANTMSKESRAIGVVFLLCLSLSLSHAYKDVVFIHGIFAGAEEFDYFTQLIKQNHPGTHVHAIPLYQYIESIAPLWMQVDSFVDKVQSILTNRSSEGTVLISYSQGGMISRGILSVLKHNVDTWISLSGPLAGQFGDTEYLKDLFPNHIRDDLYKVCYTKGGQELSVANYWNDPKHQDLYKNFSNYLAVLNNESTIADPKNQEYRANFMRLRKLVLVGSPDDGVITPWQSSHFGVFDKELVAHPMEEQKWFQNDAFGLKTLSKMGAVHLFTEPHVKHHYWHVEKKIFDKYILPWLS